MKTKHIVYTLIAVIIFFLFVNWTVKSREKGECEMWQKSYSIAKWQKDQCEHYNIPLNGLVRPGTK